ncbi:histone-lysine N-methyltransferase ASHR2-like [Neltuma alba]|uniref:histone-lysine N-methyltransferase ASHR2-like n=1 Tax=Neltuma alba TaxID=207710 RepID=UPI0010A3662E|nr:histone-lysine N-methyltransferase ASHR2-like [Prosopis alba]
MGGPSASSVLCPSCRHHRFCSPECLSIAQNTSHTSWVCQALSHLRANSVLVEQPLECQVQVHFLIAAYNLANVSPSAFQTLLSLQGSPDDTTIALAQFLHPLITSLQPFAPTSHQNGFSLELTAALLAKDKLNAFGLMQPFSEDNDQRSVRAYGREVCLSYFPVNENYSRRQKRLAEDYGFTCKCDRCNVEANWSDNDSVEDDAEDIEESMDEDECENMAASDTESNPQGDNSDFPHAYFFLKFMCDRKNCWGTLAPLPPQGNSPSNVMECNVCGNLKSDNVLDGDGGQDGVSMED